jgi:hypothetical protein
MPNLNTRIPKYCHHRASGQAYVTLGGGADRKIDVVHNSVLEYPSNKYRPSPGCRLGPATPVQPVSDISGFPPLRKFSEC